MPTYAVLTFPVDELRLTETMRCLSEVYCHVEQTAMGNAANRLHLWISCRDTSNIPDALDADSTVRDHIRLQRADDDHLYRLDLEPGIHLPRRTIHRHEGTIRDAYGDANGWTFEVRFPDREQLASVDELFDRYDADVAYRSITKNACPSEDVMDRLTDPQREVVEMACNRGYYAVPRNTTLEEIADELGVSHQALSERFRRANEKLARNHLDVGETHSSLDTEAR